VNRRILILLLSGLVALALGGGIAAAAHSGTHTPSPARGKSASAPKDDQADQADENGQDGEGVHGGSVDRVHDNCPLPDGVSLSGNWTHGDYVSAWAKSDPTTAKDAAQSPCGKPAAASSHGGDHAQGQSGEHRHGPPSTIPPQPSVPTHP
jgi:hypothetical protein